MYLVHVVFRKLIGHMGHNLCRSREPVTFKWMEGDRIRSGEYPIHHFIPAQKKLCFLWIYFIEVVKVTVLTFFFMKMKPIFSYQVDFESRALYHDTFHTKSRS